MVEYDEYCVKSKVKPKCVKKKEKTYCLVCKKKTDNRKTKGVASEKKLGQQKPTRIDFDSKILT